MSFQTCVIADFLSSVQNVIGFLHFTTDYTLYDCVCDE